MAEIVVPVVGLGLLWIVSNQDNNKKMTKKKKKKKRLTGIKTEKKK